VGRHHHRLDHRRAPRRGSCPAQRHVEDETAETAKTAEKNVFSAVSASSAVKQGYAVTRHPRRTLRRSEGPRADREPRTARAQRRRDRVGCTTCESDIVSHIPPSAKHFNVVLQTLDRSKPERPGNLAVPLNKMAEHFKRRGILVLISDFYEEPDAILEAIKPL